MKTSPNSESSAGRSISRMAALVGVLTVSATWQANSASIGTHPASQTVIQGQPATLTVSASGSGVLAYQWQKDGIDIPGATTGQLRLGAVKPWDKGVYRVRVTDSVNSVLSNHSTVSLHSTLPADLWNGLLLFLPFAGNNLDVSASARTITQSAVGVSNGPHAGVAGAAAFDGVTSRLDFAPNLPDLTSMTISFWMKNDSPVGYRSLFIDWDDAASNDFGISLNDQTFSVFANKNGASLSWTSGNVIQPKVWNHIMWVMAPTVSKVYLNGQLVATVNSPADNVGYKLRSNIGYFNYAGGKDFFQGSLSAFRIYGRALSDPEAVALYSADAPAPEIIVEQPEGSELTDGAATTSFAALPIGGTSSPIVYSIRNVGSAALQGLSVAKSGSNPGDFVVGALGSASLTPGVSTTFSVTFAPTSGASGARTAAIQIASNDADETPFDIALSGAAYSTTLDMDNDGMSDWGEFRLAALGFDWQVANTALVSALYSNADAAGLYSASQVQNLNVGTPLLQRNPANGEFVLTIGIEKSLNLGSWSLFPISAPQTTVNGQGKMEVRFSVPDNAAFFKLFAQ